MGRKFNQLLLLVKKNFQILIPRIISVTLELFIPLVLLVGCGFLRGIMENEMVCMGGYNPVEFDNKIWANGWGQADKSLIAIGPNTDVVRNVVSIMKQQQQYSFFTNTTQYMVLDPNGTKADWNAQLKTYYATENNTIIVFPTEAFMDETLELSSTYFRAAVVFSNSTTSAAADNLNYTIRMHQTDSKYDTWNTDLNYLKYEIDIFTGRGDASPYTDAWYQLQQLIEISIAIYKGATYIPSVAVRAAPHPSYEKDIFVSFVAPYVTILSFLISAMFMASSVASDIIEEKCSKMREMMRMMGLTDSIMWLAWFIQRLCLVLVLSVTVTIALKVSNYMPDTDGSLVFVLVLEFYVLMVVWCFFLTTLIHKGSIAGFAMCVATYLTYLPYDTLSEQIEGFDRQTRILLCLFPLTAIAQGILVIGDWESIGQGLSWANVGSGVSAIDMFTMSDVMGTMLFMMIVFALLGWYIENVFPGDYGVPEKWYFMFTRKYWTGNSDKSVQTLSKENGTIDKLPYDDPTCHEELPPGMTPGVIIRNLDKTFKTLVGPKVAVEKLSLEMFEGQITALLGHNGAGKTTTINMLTGMFPPSGGDAVIAGHSIMTSMKQVRDSMGICPQHNILFKMMNVEQHLDFFIRLKGVTGAAVQEEIEHMLGKLGLADKRKTTSHKLSGGQKRKLSVGIALSGGSKFILLDEPTSGMDPYSRRSTWDILLAFKENRTILFTTHSMDEADLLGDRIAIMADGKLVCSGSSLFLKRRYGVGYNLTLVKDKSLTEDGVKKITGFVQEYVPSAELNSNIGAELSYLLSDAESQGFVPLFKKLETENEDYGINAFGVSLTTMEEVFMKAGEAHHLEATKDTKLADDGVKQIRKFQQDDLNTGLTLYAQQLGCQINKRFINFKRNRGIVIAQFLLPIIFTIIGLLGYTSAASSLTGNARILTLSNYPSNEINGSIYFADLRHNPGSDTYKEQALAYLKTLYVNVNDSSDEAKALNGSYSGDTDSCCSNPYLQLNSSCIDKFNPSLWEECLADKYKSNDWTYRGCYSECIKQNGDSCTIQPYNAGPPDTKYVADELSYFTNLFLEASDKYKGFFSKTIQGAITLSDLDNINFVSRIDANRTETPAKSNNTDYTVPQFDNSNHLMMSWASYKGVHVVPGLQNAMANIILQINNIDAKIQVTNHPLPQTLEDSYTSSNDASIIVLVFCFVFGMSFNLASFVVFLVDERTGKSKHLQQISGVNPIVYWLGTFIWDYCNYFLSAFCVFIVFCCFNMDAFQGERLGGLFLIMMFLGFGCIPLVYMLSHIFSKGTTAFGVITAFLFMVGSAGYLMYSIVLGLYEMEGGASKAGNKYAWVLDVDKVCLLHPIYAASVGIANLVDGYNKELTYKKCLESGLGEALCKQAYPTKGVFNLDSTGTGIGRNLLALFLVGLFLFVVQLVFEVYWAQIRFYLGRAFARLGLKIRGIPVKNQPSDAEDERVKHERTRVTCELQTLIDEEAVVMHNLSKQFGKKAAVQNISLSINKGECFGLLGVNGAGKTTTFSMLTGDLAPSSGETYMYGHNVVSELRQVQRYIGYCPQHDALIGIMTGREMLTMFANLRGISKDVIADTVQEVIEMFDLTNYADKQCQTYSGGNKRKLSTGLAIIGTPPVIFLDEPTSGMDPTASRFLWNVLCFLRTMGCSIVLTSHSMEECEALCTQLVIMVNGSLQCLGSIQELKNTYSQGFTLTVVMDEENQARVQDFIEKRFPGGEQKEQHTGYLLYSLGTTHKWSEIFEAMESNKVDLGVKDYSVSQTSLEQVFLNFARLQEPEKEKLSFGAKLKKNCCGCCNKDKVDPEEQQYLGYVGSNQSHAASESV